MARKNDFTRSLNTARNTPRRELEEEPSAKQLALKAAREKQAEERRLRMEAAAKKDLQKKAERRKHLLKRRACATRIQVSASASFSLNFLPLDVSPPPHP